MRKPRERLRDARRLKCSEDYVALHEANPGPNFLMCSNSKYGRLIFKVQTNKTTLGGAF